MATVKTTSGAAAYICSTPTTASTQSALAALTYVAIGKVESLGQVGPSSQDVTFINIDGSPVQHLKGSTDNGTTVIQCGRDPLDAGQIALKAASLTKFEYAIKIVLEDANDGNDPDSIIYVRGPVMGGQINLGGANDVTKVTYTIGNNVFIEVPTTAVP